MTAGEEIRSEGYYEPFAVSQAFGIPESEQKRARDNEELRFTKKGRRILYRGQWLIDWLAPVKVSA